MADPSTNTRKNRVDAAPTAQGVVDVGHRCPLCQAVTHIPVPRLAEGSLGIFVCEKCEGKFEMELILSPINVPNRPQTHPPNSSKSRAGIATRIEQQDRLLALCGEDLFLRQRQQEIANEIADLRAALEAAPSSTDD